eukprot:g5048.t1
MDLEHADRLNDSGFCLSVEEKAGLQIAMLRRKHEESFETFQFWGKVFGKQNDYIVCYGLLPSYDYPAKKFYFCNANKIELQQMPELSEADAARLAKASPADMFEGDPSFIIEEAEAPEAAEGAEPPAPLTELQRLASTVAAIDADTATVPRGAWIVSPTHQVVKNVSYTGLNFEAAAKLESYYHFREAKDAETVQALQKPGMVRDGDFLDSLAGDQPSGTWSVQWNASRTQSSLRSLVWPGYFFFHAVSTPFFGGAYFGYGQKNVDLAFNK